MVRVINNQFAFIINLLLLHCRGGVGAFCCWATVHHSVDPVQEFINRSHFVMLHIWKPVHEFRNRLSFCNVAYMELIKALAGGPHHKKLFISSIYATFQKDSCSRVQGLDPPPPNPQITPAPYPPQPSDP